MKVLIVAGEASGDLHAADVLRELKTLDPQIEAFGIGGDRLKARGMKILYHARQMAIVGLFNVMRHLRMFRRVFEDLMAAVEEQKPDVAILVDYPDFNLRVARRCKELGVPVVYYISPQLWAWRRGRVRHIAKYVDRMLVIFPFEEAFYRDHGVPVTYVGHPLIEQVTGVRRAKPRPGVTRVVLLPGSRRMEVADLLPPMLDALQILRRGRDIEPFIIQAPTIEDAQLEKILRSKRAEVPILPHDRGEGIAAADVALSSSGTATLECAVLGTPVVVMYRLSRATHWLAQKLVSLPHFSLVNIIAGREVVPELLQDEVSGKRIAAAVVELLEPANYARVKEELALVRAALGGPGASQRAAAEVYKLVRG